MQRPDAGREPILLLRSARAGTLATADGGQPFASLITPATAPDGSVLMLLSGLSEHTRHLLADPRCAVMVQGAQDGPNVQTAPRLTVLGEAVRETDAALKARWVALHPYAAFYAGFDDFTLWRVRPRGGSYIGGFARAFRLSEAQLTPDPAHVEAVAGAEASIVAHCNDDHPEALEAIAAGTGLQAGPWRMVACDVDGFDLVLDEVVRRIAWPAPVDGGNAVRAGLVHLAGAARNAAKTSAGPGEPTPV